MRTLALARAVAPPTGRNPEAGAVAVGMGGETIAAISISGPNMTVMITGGAHHGYHVVRDCSEMEQFDRRNGDSGPACLPETIAVLVIASANRLC